MVMPRPSLLGFMYLLLLRDLSHARTSVRLLCRSPCLPQSRRAGCAVQLPYTPGLGNGGRLGALGQITAKWLAGQVARHIRLLGRSSRWWFTDRSAAAALT